MNIFFLSKIKQWAMRIFIIIGTILLVNWYQTKDITSKNLEKQIFFSLKEEKRDLWKSNKKNLLFFFAPWCSICKINMPTLDLIKNEDTHVVAIALSYRSKNDVAKMSKPLIKSTPILLGSHNLGEKLNINAFPTILFVNKKGEIQYKTVGLSNLWAMKIRLWLTR